MEPRSPEGANIPKKQRLFTRRQVLVGGTGAFIAGLAATAAPRFLRRSVPPAGEPPATQVAQKQEPTSTVEPTQQVQSEPTLQPTTPPKEAETTQPIEPTEDAVKAPVEEVAATPDTEVNREEAKHLRRIYRDRMDGKASGEYYKRNFTDKKEREAQKLEFFDELTRVANRINPNNPLLANQIAAVINVQSGFSPRAEIDTGDGTKAAGLLKFSQKTLESMGISPEQMVQLSPVEQLQFVEIYLRERQEALGRPLKTLKDVSLAVIQPSAIDEPYDTELFPKGTKRYERYKAFDRRKKGCITSSDVVNCVIDEAVQRGEGESREQLFRPDDKVPEYEPIADPEVFLRMSLDLKEAYDYAADGYTFDKPNMDKQLTEFLRKRGYSEQQLAALVDRRSRSMVPHTNTDGSGKSGIASECLGWVGCAVSLWTGNSEPHKSLNDLGRAGAINDVYKNGTVPVGNFSFRAIGEGKDATIQLGDIAVCGTAAGGDHIGIVNKVPEDPERMGLLESNGYVTARVTDDRKANDGGPLYKWGYTFYRLQPNS